MASVLETIKEITFKLLLIVNGTRLKVGVPIKSISFERAHELLDHKVFIGANIITSFHKVGNMLARVFFAIELLKLWWLVAC